MGMQARLMSQALRKLSGAIKQTNTAVVFTNQLRQKIGVMFGNPETTTGGMALKFYASVRLDVRRIQSIKLGQEIIGNRTRVRVVKNKVAPPFRTAEFDIMYNEGISKSGDILDLATELNIIEKRGSFYSFGDIRLGQGRENAKEYLRENVAMADEIELAIRQQALSGDLPMPVNGGGEESDLMAEEEL
jgi:recombination protein RecA